MIISGYHFTVLCIFLFLTSSIPLFLFYLFLKINNRLMDSSGNSHLSSRQMTHVQTLRPPHGGMIQQTPESCPLTSTDISWYMCTWEHIKIHSYTHTHTNKGNEEKKRQLQTFRFNT